MARVWYLSERPGERLTADIFELKQVEEPPLNNGEVRVKNAWLSVDPFMRRLLGAECVGMTGVSVDAPMFGSAIGEVVESKATVLAVGTPVLHGLGWRDSSVLPSSACTNLAGTTVPLQRYLGHLGIAGQTAYFGLLSVGEAKSGEVLFVSAAGGAVGCLVVQIAKIKGLTVIASAGGAVKCAAVAELGADVVIDYKAPGTLRSKIAIAAPAGIDIYFDNVGGAHLDAAIHGAKPGARFVLCGMIGGYGGDDVLALPDPMRMVLKRLTLRGFSAPEFNSRHAEFHADVLHWMQTAQLQCPETIVDGLEEVPNAFCRLFDGGNFGKMLVRL
jgi:NADPH-dependent curcumin reductase CurA